MYDQIFIIGPARSGTSIMMRAIRNAFPDHKSCDEGHFLDLACILEAATEDFFSRTKAYYRRFENMTISKIDLDRFNRRIANALVAENATVLRSTTIIDKTHGPLMVRSLPAIASVLPNSCAIFMKRRLNEFLRSADIKFDWWTREERIAHWTATMEAWLATRQRLGRYCLEVEHLDLVHRPTEVGHALARHLRLPIEHASAFGGFFSNHSIEKTPGGSYEPVALEEIGFSPAEAAELTHSTSDLMKRLGYGSGRQYIAT